MANRTSVTVINEDLWKWAKKKSIDLEYNWASKCISRPIEKERKGE